MKKIYLLSTLFVTMLIQAQVPNNGFEQTLDDGFTLKNWGAFFPINIVVGPGDEPIEQPNTILFDNGVSFSMPVGDCITGSWAMQISNAFDTVNNVVIPGKASLFDDSNSPTHTGWNNGVQLPDGALVQFLGFDYKFFPAGNDVAMARLELFNEGGESIGVAEVQITQAVSDFQYVYVPIDFTLDDTPKFMTIDFAMQKDGSEVNSWSTLIVDNVVVNTMMLGVAQNQNAPFTVFPTVANTEINIVANDIAAGQTKISVVNMEGKIVTREAVLVGGTATTIDVSGLASGVYLLNAESETGKSVTRFIKK
jgi:hypothetical protein